MFFNVSNGVGASVAGSPLALVMFSHEPYITRKVTTPIQLY